MAEQSDLEAVHAEPANLEAVRGASHAIGELAAHSLITVAGSRIGMLDTIREVVLEQLTQDGDRAAHAGHFLRLLRDGEPRLAGELDNVRAAVEYAVNAPRLLDGPTVRALTGHYVARGWLAEGQRMLTAAAGAAGTAEVRAWAWHRAAVTANESGDADAALDLAACAAQAFGGGPAGRAATLTLIGNAHKTAGRYDEAATAYAEVLDLPASRATTVRDH